MKAGNFVIFLIIATIVIAVSFYLYRHSNFESLKDWGTLTNFEYDKGECPEEPTERSEKCYEKTWNKYGSCRGRNIQEAWGSPDHDWDWQKKWANKQTMTHIIKDMINPLNCANKRRFHL